MDYFLALLRVKALFSHTGVAGEDIKGVKSYRLPKLEISALLFRTALS